MAAYADAAPASSDELIREHAGLIKRIAQHLAARLPSTVEIDDLIQAGAVGLLESARRFDPSHGASFSTYATIRIRGAMLDQLRSYDWSPRSTRRKIREMSKAIQEIEMRTGSAAQPSEVASAMDMDPSEYGKLLQDSASFSLYSLDDLLERRGDSVFGSTAADPLDNLERRTARDELKAVIESLPEREQLVLSLYYDQECNLREIGEILNVSESRVCQIHGQTLARIRARLVKANRAETTAGAEDDDPFGG